jgi:hypothetical protein
MSDLAPEERLAIATKFILSAPPGELDVCVRDVKELLAVCETKAERRKKIDYFIFFIWMERKFILFYSLRFHMLIYCGTIIACVHVNAINFLFFLFLFLFLFFSFFFFFFFFFLLLLPFLSNFNKKKKKKKNTIEK